LEYNAEIREVNTDMGTQFFSNKKEGTSLFQKYLKSQDIKHIPSRVHNHLRERDSGNHKRDLIP